MMYVYVHQVASDYDLRLALWIAFVRKLLCVSCNICNVNKAYS